MVKNNKTLKKLAWKQTTKSSSNWLSEVEYNYKYQYCNYTTFV